MTNSDRGPDGRSARSALPRVLLLSGILLAGGFAAAVYLANTDHPDHPASGTDGKAEEAARRAAIERQQEARMRAEEQTRRAEATGHWVKVADLPDAPAEFVPAAQRPPLTAASFRAVPAKVWRNSAGLGASALAVAPDGSALALGWEQALGLLDVDAQAIAPFALPPEERAASGAVQALAYTPDGKRLAVGTYSGVVVLDLASRAVAVTLEQPAGTARCVAYSPDGRRLVVCDPTARAVAVWDVPSGRRLAALRANDAEPRAAAFSPDGATLASAGGWTGAGEVAVQLWDAATTLPTTKLVGHASEIEALAWAPDGHRVAAGARNGEVRVWTVPEGAPGVLAGHTHTVAALAFSPDGGWLASGSHDGTVRIWEVATGTTAVTLTKHTGPVTAVAFAPDGRYLATAGRDGTLLLWAL